jgi:hypothetical protein
MHRRHLGVRWTIPSGIVSHFAINFPLASFHVLLEHNRSASKECQLNHRRSTSHIATLRIVTPEHFKKKERLPWIFLGGVIPIY